MGKSLHVKTLATAIGVALAGVVTLPNAALAAPANTALAAKTVDASQASIRHVYIIRFVESGLLHYNGGINGLAATQPAATGVRKLDSRSAASVAYKGWLATQRDAHLASIDNAIGRTLAPSHSYAVIMNGVAVELTASEAGQIAGLPGVRDVRRSIDQQLDTFRGPEFIGADEIWDGTSVPGNVATRGQGVVVGVIDSGGNIGHPSFTDDAACGFTGVNPKLLGSEDCLTSAGGVCTGTSPNADAGNGHGVHTASTAAGNTVTAAAVPPPVLPAGESFMSGVAPCASLRTYKVCATTNCSGAAIVAAIENAITDQVDVINFSISGGQSPWSDNDRDFLDAVGADIFVAASAGNTRAETPDPVGAVNHLGPWMTTVAASTHDANVASDGALSITGPGTPPAELQNIPLNPGSGPNPGTPLPAVEIRHSTDNLTGCTADGGFPAGFFDNAIALIQRGTCSFEEKVNNADTAGAEAAIIFNNAAGAINMNTGGSTLPAYSILQAEGEAIIAWAGAADPDVIFANGFDEPVAATPTIGDFDPAVIQGDVLAGFSLRGPSNLTSVTKPDITGPGVNIYAALDTASGSYGFNSGTSMSSPHLAGAGALLRAAHADWTPQEVKSAIMLTAFTAGTKEDTTTPWDPDDVGAGRVDLTKAAMAGFVMDETFANFVAANPGTGGDPKTLNIPSMRNLNCVDSCDWTRTLRNAVNGTPTSWTVTVNAPAGVSVSTDVTNFTFDGTLADTQAITITAEPTEALTEIKFAEVVFTEAGGLAPAAHMYVAVQGSGSGGGDIVDSGVVNIAIPPTFDGLYLNWVTGGTADANINIYDVDVADPANGLHFFWPQAGGEGGVSLDGVTYAILASGATIGPASTFIAAGGSADTSNWQAGVDGYLGFQFICPAPGGFCYGYTNMTTTAPQGFPATVVRYVSNSAGDAITIP